MQMTYNIDGDCDLEVGSIILVDGKDHKVIKKTTTAIQVRRYYFWDRWLDRLYDKYFRKETNEY